MRQRPNARYKQSSNLLAYLGNYGEIESIQPASAAAFDSQLKNLSLSLATKIAGASAGAVLDIGCGEGILLKRLIEIDSFNSNKEWIYFGIDFPKNTKQVMQLAVDLQVHRRADTCSIDEFFTQWPQVDRAPRPYILVARNVFHELDIDQTAKLLHHVVQHLDQNDLIIVQDIQVFPVSERGNACWLPQNFSALLSSIGFQTTFVDEPTAKGNRWFTLIGTRRPEKTLPVDAVLAAVIAERKKQYDYWIAWAG